MMATEAGRTATKTGPASIGELRIKNLGGLAEDPFLILRRQGLEAGLGLIQVGPKRTFRSGEVRTPRQALAAKFFNKNREECLGTRVALLHIAEDARRQLKIYVLDRRQFKQAGRGLVWRSVEDIGTGKVIEDDRHVWKTAGEACDLRQPHGSGLDTHRQAQFAAQLPGRKGIRVVEFAGIEVLGAATGE